MSVLPPDLPALRSPKQRLALRLNLQLFELGELLMAHWNETARRYGLAPSQVKVLLALGGDETVTMRALADRLRYDASNLTTLVDRLEREGLVERHAHPTDRRVTGVRLTAKGVRTRDGVWQAVNTDGPLHGLTKDQLAVLSEGLGRALPDPS
ncbi:MarR family winged helix-turn-helix transcriptional regulator [Conexibacter sp. CPCC 206217]|uniref:MarR family winged helix-turn-helix transcriptional regulator n=1 Tax=Conexibacter sp. CPCC 206217 TaxID=3064574 RepID=UPI002720C52C|nr:MarR family transcriptional regulator [Conexibacter sp. CPCC 206217]MDO8209097.1 MarR family transcriptional regulator [Conexibacter sp. CPCC 206217]